MKPRAPSFVRFPFKAPNALSPVLGRIGTLETRLARSRYEIRAAQSLRYTVFYEELGAKANRATHFFKRDKDQLDHYCDHLLVLDTNQPDHQQIVGTYRLLDQTSAGAAGGFYSQSEFDVTRMLNADPDKRYLELGRSCIKQAYRSRRTIELMWQGIWAIMLDRNIDTLFGCASFAGTNPLVHKQGLGWLRRNALVDKAVDCPAVAAHHFPLPDLHDNKTNASKRAFGELPPLLKGYLRVGAKVATHAVVDHKFDTIDVLVVLNAAEINKKYIAHYGADASRFAA